MTPSDNGSAWDLPLVTLHDDVTSLISRLYGYNVLSFQPNATDYSVPSGALVLEDLDRFATLSALSGALGIDLTKSYSYMLVRLRRLTSAATHEYVSNFGAKDRGEYLTAEARAAYAALAAGQATAPQDGSLTSAEAQAYVASFYRHGTHFVSRIQFGDMIWQVFAYEAPAFAELKKAFDHDKNTLGEVGGLDALNYQYYTTPASSATGHPYGYTAAAGKVLAWSRDPLLAASLAKGQWRDESYVGGDSIFMPFVRPGKPNAILTQFRQVVPVAFDLKPLAALIPLTNASYRGQVWARLFDGALVQKYGSAVRVPFKVKAPALWSAVFGDNTDWLSTILTPTVNVYQDYLDLRRIQMSNVDEVSTFSTFSQVLQATGEAPIVLPGSTITLVSYLIDTSASDTVPVLQLSDAGFKNLVLTCGRMIGVLMVTGRAAGARRTVMDGFLFAFGDPDAATGRATVKLLSDIHARPSLPVLKSLTTSMQFSLVSAETRLYARGTNAQFAETLARAYLYWLAGLIPEELDDAELAGIQMQALYLARIAGNLNAEGVTVSYLRYASYQSYVESLIASADSLSDQIRDFQREIRERKQTELLAKGIEDLNDNIKKTGKLLTDYFSAVAQNQQDMAGYYDDIVTKKQQEFDKSVVDIAQLQTQLQTQQAEVKSAVASFKQALATWEKEQVAKFCLQLAVDVFSLGAAIAAPSSELKAVASLGQTAQKIQKVLNVLSILAKIEQGIETQIRTMQGVSRTLSQLSSDVDMPSSREWSEFSINMDSALTTVPNDPGVQQAKADLVAAFKILVLRGQAWVDARGKQRQLLTDIYYNLRLRQINQAQAKRVDDLTKALHLGDTSKPETARIDLIGLTGQVQYQLNQVLAVLARTLAIQDAAVQYEYLGQPTAIKQFDLNSLKTVMRLQKDSIVTALEQLNPPPLPVSQPIQYRIVGVPVSELKNGGVYEFVIQPSATEFFRYTMVRVTKVVASVEGISGSASGEYLLNVTYRGDPFLDRDANRQLITFNTVERHLGPYNYDIASGQARFGDQTSTLNDKLTAFTPFSTWQVSLPPTSINKGLTFSGPTVDIVLTFSITARLVDSAALRAMRAPHSSLLAADSPLLADAPSTATRERLLEQMYQNQAVLKGWDVVLNMLEDRVNDFIKEQFKKKVGPQEEEVITVGFCQTFLNPEGEGQIAAYTRFNITLGPPLVQFQQNNSAYVAMTQKILKGSLDKGALKVGNDWDPAKNCNLSDPGIKWRHTDLPLDGNPSLNFSVPITVVNGLVQSRDGSTNTHSVVLDFAKGTVIAQNIKVDTDNAELNNRLSAYFQTTERKYIINTVVFDDKTTLPSLRPSSFRLNVLGTNSKKQILQLFITTSGKQQNNLTIDVNEPIPDGYENSLMINTKIMFEDIFVHSFNQAGNLAVEAVNPGPDFKAYSAKISKGSVTSRIDWGKDYDKFRLSSSSNDLTTDITGLKFQRREKGGLDLHFIAKPSVGFEYRTQMKNPRGGYYWTGWRSSSVDVNLNMTGTYAITTGGEGKNQFIQIASAPPEVNVDNTDIKPTGPCECNDNDLKLQVINTMAKSVPQALAKQMAGVEFKAISLFALYNLLFPAKTLIQTKECYLPGDLLVLGTFASDAS
ncbi:hypothetical protein BO221_42730 [Archangium sp. Cb G35]|nr:hypothetical protein BO221_42730 [Archangium sp. Cb G35]